MLLRKGIGHHMIECGFESTESPPRHILHWLVHEISHLEVQIPQFAAGVRQKLMHEPPVYKVH